MLAELPVRDPGRTFHIGLEREGIDKYWFAIFKLNVVGRGIFENIAVLQCYSLNAQRKHCCILQLTEAPLIRIGDIRDNFGCNDAIAIWVALNIRRRNVFMGN